MSQETLYKFTDETGRPIHGGLGQWFLPSGKRPGEWMPAVAHPQACLRGYHLCTGAHLLQWTGPALWVAEGRGQCDTSDTDKLCFEQARLVRRVDGWNERTQRVFACDCAERVIHLCGDDPRPAETIRVARLFADGQAIREELDAASASASASARDAARDAAWFSARAAARDAAWFSARAAARDAAWDAAWDAARDAAWFSARDAARAAAWDAAWDAAWGAAWDAAWGAERAWQAQHLLELIGEAAPLEVA